MVTGSKVKEEAFVLTRVESGIVETDVVVSAGMKDVIAAWEFPVPVGHSLVFSPQDTFSAYLEDSQATPVEAVAGSLVDIVIMDSSRQSLRTILNQLRYGDVKEFQDRDKIRNLDIQPGSVVVAEEGERVLIRVYILTQTLDASDCYFNLTCKRVRHTLFE